MSDPMTDPTTLSLADLALAAGAIGAHRLDGDIVDIDGIKLAGVSESREMDLILAAANRLPAVVAECERLRAALEWRLKADAARDEVDRLQSEVPALRIKCHHMTEALTFVRGRLREALDLAECIGLAPGHDIARLLMAVDEMRLEAGVDVVVPSNHLKETP